MCAAGRVGWWRESFLLTVGKIMFLLKMFWRIIYFFVQIFNLDEAQTDETDSPSRSTYLQPSGKHYNKCLILEVKLAADT